MLVEKIYEKLALEKSFCKILATNGGILVCEIKPKVKKKLQREQIANFKGKK